MLFVSEAFFSRAQTHLKCSTSSNDIDCRWFLIVKVKGLGVPCRSGLKVKSQPYHVVLGRTRSSQVGLGRPYPRPCLSVGDQVWAHEVDAMEALQSLPGSLSASL